jgi:hypothetical protein
VSFLPVDSAAPLGEGAAVSWERRLLDLFDDLEQQAEGAALVARDAEVAELARSEYSEVGLADRWHASTGRHVELTALGGVVVRGRVARVGAGWCLVVPEPGATTVQGQEWLVALSGLVAVRGLSPQAQPASLRPLTARLGLASALRGIADDQEQVTVVRTDGERRRGRVGRVGRDFLELLDEAGRLEVVPFSAVSAVRR